MKILEVGCGNGDFWRKASKIVPVDCDITLTDFSAGMLAEAEKNLAQLFNFKFEVADVENLSYPAGSFDIVLAHLMLYHAASKEKALKEIKRVLKPSGFAGILLSGEDNMQSLFTLLNCDNPRQATHFTSEIAIKILPKYFSTVKHYTYQNVLKIPSTEPLIAYLESFSSMPKKGDAFYSRCKEILENYIKDNGYLTLETSRHLFITSNI